MWVCGSKNIWRESFCIYDLRIESHSDTDCGRVGEVAEVADYDGR